MMTSVAMVVDGVLTVVRSMVPMPSTALADAADDYIEEADPEPGRQAPTPAELALKRALAQPSEGERVKQAAMALVVGRPVYRSMLDPSLGRDKQVLDWIAALTPEQVQMLASASVERIERHLDGLRTLSLPTFSDVIEQRNADARLQEPPLTEEEWLDVLRSRASVTTSPVVSLDAMARNAHLLARRGWNLEHARRHAAELATKKDAA